MPIHQTLKAWQHAERLAVECSKAPRYSLTANRACSPTSYDEPAYSIPLNIAEGCARKGTREYRRYLDIAWGSLAEVETALAIARDVGYLRPAEFGRLEALATETSKTLFGLMRKISESAEKSHAIPLTPSC